MGALFFVGMAILLEAAQAGELTAYPGWSLSELEEEDHSYQERGLFVLQPPDSRPPITVRAALAERIRSGALSPEAAYRDRRSSLVEASEDRSAGGADPAFGAAEEAPRPRPATSLASHEAPASGVSTPSPAARDPDGKTRPPRDPEESIAACAGSANLGELPDPPWKLPAAKLVCSEKDVEEELRRLAFDLCAPGPAKETAVALPGAAESAWFSPVQSWLVNDQELSLGQGIVRCQGIPEPYRAGFILREHRGECWVCGTEVMIQSASYHSALDWEEALPALQPVDLRAGPRSSPREAEAPDREAYWHRAR